MKPAPKPPSVPALVAFLATSVITTIGGVIYFIQASKNPPHVEGVARVDLPGWPQWVLWGVAILTGYLGYRAAKKLQALSESD